MPKCMVFGGRRYLRFVCVYLSMCLNFRALYVCVLAVSEIREKVHDLVMQMRTLSFSSRSKFTLRRPSSFPSNTYLKQHTTLSSHSIPKHAPFRPSIIVSSRTLRLSFSLLVPKRWNSKTEYCHSWFTPELEWSVNSFVNYDHALDIGFFEWTSIWNLCKHIFNP
jgi:hypothetical protein